jgi:hypothetical protein
MILSGLVRICLSLKIFFPGKKKEGIPTTDANDLRYVHDGVFFGSTLSARFATMLVSSLSVRSYVQLGRSVSIQGLGSLDLL